MKITLDHFKERPPIDLKSIFPDMKGAKVFQNIRLKKPAVPEQVEPPDKKNEEPMFPQSVKPPVQNDVKSAVPQNVKAVGAP